VEHRQQERDTDIVVPLLQLPDELALRRVLERDRGSVEVLGDVVEGEVLVDGARAEYALRAGDLAEQELVTDAGAVAVFRPERTADTGQQDSGCGCGFAAAGLFVVADEDAPLETV